jgi:hypothetical protein
MRGIQPMAQPTPTRSDAPDRQPPTAAPAGAGSETANGTGLKPHPRLLRVLSIVFALWFGLLLVLYFWTVYPVRHPGH